MLSDPIVALATPPGRSALAVIRLSGTGAFGIAAQVERVHRVRAGVVTISTVCRTYNRPAPQ